MFPLFFFFFFRGFLGGIYLFTLKQKKSLGLFPTALGTLQNLRNLFWNLSGTLGLVVCFISFLHPSVPLKPPEPPKPPEPSRCFFFWNPSGALSIFFGNPSGALPFLFFPGPFRFCSLFLFPPETLPKPFRNSSPQLLRTPLPPLAAETP